MLKDIETPIAPSDAQTTFAEKYHGPVVAWIILAISLVLTATAYIASHHLVEKRLEDQFEFRSNEISNAIQDRLFIYEQILWSGVALFDATPQPVERNHWRNFVNALNINEHWQGIQGFGYSVPVTSIDKESHIQSIRDEGFLDYKIAPEGERDAYSAIIYLEPFDWRNKRAFGYDMWSNEMRRTAMARARDEGVAATSGIITLVQETQSDVQRGFLTYVPVYKHPPEDTVESRRALFQGWVYAPFRAGNLMEGILGSGDSDIIFDIYDGPERNEASLLYSSVKNGDQDASIPFLTKTRSLELQGRTWSLEFRTPPGFTTAQESKVPRSIAVVGLIIDSLLFYVILSLYSINRRANNIATNMTKGIQEAKIGLEKQVSERTQELSQAHQNLERNIQQRTQELHDKVNELENMNTLTSGREIRIIELKQEVNSLSKDLDITLPYNLDEQTPK